MSAHQNGAVLRGLAYDIFSEARNAAGASIITHRPYRRSRKMQNAGIVPARRREAHSKQRLIFIINLSIAENRLAASFLSAKAANAKPSKYRRRRRRANIFGISHGGENKLPTSSSRILLKQRHLKGKRIPITRACIASRNGLYSITAY